MLIVVITHENIRALSLRVTYELVETGLLDWLDGRALSRLVIVVICQEWVKFVHLLGLSKLMLVTDRATCNMAMTIAWRRHKVLSALLRFIYFYYLASVWLSLCLLLTSDERIRILFLRLWAKICLESLIVFPWSLFASLRFLAFICNSFFWFFTWRTAPLRSI